MDGEHGGTGRLTTRVAGVRNNAEGCGPSQNVGGRQRVDKNDLLASPGFAAGDITSGSQVSIIEGAPF